MIVFKPTLPTHRHYCFLHFVFVLFMLVTKEPQLIKASTLVIEGYDLVELSRDRSTLATGFQSPINSVGTSMMILILLFWCCCSFSKFQLIIMLIMANDYHWYFRKRMFMEYILRELLWIWRNYCLLLQI